MYPRRSFRAAKVSEESPGSSPNEDVIRRKSQGRSRRTGQKKTQVHEGQRDILDLINGSYDAECVAREGEGGSCLELAAKVVDQSDEDCASVSSVTSGPSMLRDATPEEPRPSLGSCSACQKLYKRAKRMKAPVKNKLLDNDPKSLSCDQWLLIKTCRPRRPPTVGGNLIKLVHQIKKRLVKNGAKQTGLLVGSGEASACWRPHTFLQRNLRRCVRAPPKKETKKNRRKRTRVDSQGSRGAKQQCLQSNQVRRDIMADISSGQSSSSVSNSGYGEVTIELIPSEVTLETTKPRAASPTRKSPRKTAGFRNLLAQLRGNSSMITREKR